MSQLSQREASLLAREASLLAREAALDHERAAWFVERAAQRDEMARQEADLELRSSRVQHRLEGLATRLAAAAFARVLPAARQQQHAPARAAIDEGDPCADAWHTAQCREAVPHASDSTRPAVLDTTALPRLFRHSNNFPMFATNAALIAGSPAMQLHALRITPLALSCTPIEMSAIINTRYHENSHALIVSGLSPMLHGGHAASPTVLLNFSNAEDPRGILEDNVLWLFYTTSIRVYYPGKVKPQELGRIEMRKLSWPGLQPLMRTNLAWDGNVGVQKNWVPIVLQRTYTLVSHSLEPHVVLRCDFPSSAYQPAAGALISAAQRAAAREAGVPVSRMARRQAGVWKDGRPRYEWAVRPESPESLCKLAYRTSAAQVWHHAGFHLYEGISRLSSIRAIPRGGTPCLPMLSMKVCLGHFRTRLRGHYMRSTYFHFFYSLLPRAPYSVTNASRPFRFAPAGFNATSPLLGPSGVPRAEEAAFRSEAVQFAVGMAPHGLDTLRVTYGIGDCVSAERDVAISDVAALLSGQLQLDVL